MQKVQPKQVDRQTNTHRQDKNITVLAYAEGKLVIPETNTIFYKTEEFYFKLTASSCSFSISFAYEKLPKSNKLCY